jgi:hypothetical protein
MKERRIYPLPGLQHISVVFAPAIPASFFIYFTNLTNFGAMAPLDLDALFVRMSSPSPQPLLPTTTAARFYTQPTPVLITVLLAFWRKVLCCECHEDAHNIIVWNATSKITITCPIIMKCNACDV